jgi:hypothetical protein
MKSRFITAFSVTYPAAENMRVPAPGDSPAQAPSAIVLIPVCHTFVQGLAELRKKTLRVAPAPTAETAMH